MDVIFDELYMDDVLTHIFYVLTHIFYMAAQSRLQDILLFGLM